MSLAQIAALERKQEQLQKRIDELKAKETEAERNARNRFHHVLAGDVEAVLGDWRRIDLDEFAEWFWKVAPQARKCVMDKPRTYEEALKAANEHERAVKKAARERAKARKARAAEAKEDSSK